MKNIEFYGEEIKKRFENNTLKNNFDYSLGHALSDEFMVINERLMCSFDNLYNWLIAEHEEEKK